MSVLGLRLFTLEIWKDLQEFRKQERDSFPLSAGLPAWIRNRLAQRQREGHGKFLANLDNLMEYIRDFFSQS